LAKQIQNLFAVLLLVIIATLTASAAVTAAVICKMKEYYASRKNKDKNKRI